MHNFEESTKYTTLLLFNHEQLLSFKLGTIQSLTMKFPSCLGSESSIFPEYPISHLAVLVIRLMVSPPYRSAQVTLVYVAMIQSTRVVTLAICDAKEKSQNASFR